jgi:hypothetical protein
MATQKTLTTTAKNAKSETESFVYVLGDATKTPVDFSAQAAGTRLVLVTEGGSEYEIVAGVTRLQGDVTPEVQAKLDRMKSWDRTDAKFPNLRVSREG